MKNDTYLQDLTEIKSIMKHSTRFLSLSGFSGVSVGVIALCSSFLAFLYIRSIQTEQAHSPHISDGVLHQNAILLLFALALLTLVLSISVAYYFTLRKSKSDNTPLWTPASKKLVVDMSIPLLTGGLFSLISVVHGLFVLVAPITLICYGLSLVSASKYTVYELKHFGVIQIILGLIAFTIMAYHLIIWAFGFGVLHIFYGLMMYFRYEK